MKEFLDTFGSFTIGQAVIFIAAVGFLIGFIVHLYKTLVKYHDCLQEKDYHFNKLAKAVEKLSISEKEIQESIKELKTSQKEFAERQDEIDKEQREQSLNRLRDRLSQTFNYYASKKRNPMQAWSEIEKEAFDKLFSDYERLGGDGYMHSVVQPAMNALTVVPMSDQEGLVELMKSRTE